MVIAENVRAFLHTILQEAANGNFSFFILIAAVVQIIIICKRKRGERQ